MCGITGYYSCNGFANAENTHSLLASMTQSLRHRGPDAQGTWYDVDAGIALGHSRLSIVDLSPAGAQPMHSHCGRYIIVYNGEIYNADEIRKNVDAHSIARNWRGHSDTEAVLESFATFGVLKTVSKCIGMFAFALWDKQEKTLTLGRDRFGIKPLYYAKLGNTFFFGSELKALKAHPKFNPDINRNALANFFRCNYIPDPLTIYEDVYKVGAGEILSISAEQTIQKTQWWSALDVAQKSMQNRFTNHQEMMDGLHSLLRDVVQRRMVADVPVGAFLSGGIDSSLVVALMQEASIQKINTYCIGFSDADINEAPYAKEIARVLDTNHTELYVNTEDVLDVIPKLSSMYDEPFADSSQIPTYLVSKLARNNVIVSLSGDGGDELFAGYWQHNNNFFPPNKKMPISRSLMYQRKHYDRWDGKNVVIGGKIASCFVQGIEDDMFEHDCEMRQYLDTVHYLPSDILCKVDRASMAVSLEVRPPLLDYRLYEYAWRMPPSVRRSYGQSKWPLRHVLANYVNPELFERPKQGFATPLLEWLKGPLREWAEDLLDPKKLQQEGFLNADMVTKRWHEVLEGKKYVESIWSALMFQAWKNENV